MARLQLPSEFYIQNSGLLTTAEQEVAKLQNPALRDCGNAFVHNVRTTEETIGLPCTMASASVSSRFFQRHHLSSRIRALARDWDEQQTLEAAHDNFSREMDSKEGQVSIAEQTLAELQGHLRSVEFARAAREVLRQGAVLCWGAIEVLVGDVHRLVHSADAPGIKAALRGLLGEDPVTALKNRNLWLLFQRRHLIVHRRAIVDAAYVAQTADGATPVGNELVLQAGDLERDLRSATDAGVEILGRAAAVLP